MKLVGALEKLIPRELGEQRLVYTTFLIPGGIEETNKFPKKLPKGNATICSFAEEIKEERSLLRGSHEGDKVVTLEISIRVIKLKDGGRKIQPELSNLKNMSREKRVVVEKFYEEAYQLIEQMEAKIEKGPFALIEPTLYLKKLHKEIIEFGATGCKAASRFDNRICF